MTTGSVSAEWPGTVRAVSAELGRVLAVVAASGWDGVAANTGWTCRATIDHVASVLLHYAGQVTVAPRDHYVKFSCDLDRAQTTGELVEAVVMAGALLAAAVEVAPAGTRAWHPHGRFDAAAFAAAGSAEALVHGYDIASGLGLTWQIPDALCDPVLALLFPAAYALRPGVSGHDALIWATGRTDLPGQPRITSWSYQEGAV